MDYPENSQCINEQDREQPRPAWLTRLRNFVTWLVIQIVLATSIMLPHNAEAGTTVYSRPAPVVSNLDANGIDMSWAHWSSQSNNWVPRADPLYGYTMPIMVPKDNFALTGKSKWVPPTPSGGLGSIDFQMIQGDHWITAGREEVGQAGLTNAQVSDAAFSKFPKNTDYVFAQYSPENATAHITIQRIEKMPDGQIEVRVADFTPWHGRYWAAFGDYRTSMEVLAKVKGHNPFKNFEGASTADPLFHNVSWEAVKVAVGHAMRKYGASLSYVAVDDTRFTQNRSSKSSGFFRKKVTTTVTAYAHVHWHVGTPMELQPSGETGQICVTGTGTTSSCDDPAHVAIAGVMFQEWKGGNMPAQEDMMYQWTQVQSSWNILFFMVIIMIVTFGVASFLLPLLGPALSIGAGTMAVAAGGAYGLASTVFGSGGSLTQAQTGFFGATGNGWIQPMTSGSVQQAGLAQAIQNDMVAPQMGAGTGGMTSTDMLYKGNCPLGFTVGQCQSASLDPGTAWRPSSYTEYNLTKVLRQRMNYCAGVLGLTGVAAETCTAPAAMQY